MTGLDSSVKWYWEWATVSKTHDGPERLTWAELSGLRWSGEQGGEYSGVDPPELISGCSSVRERLAAGGADGDDMALCGSKSTSLAFHPYVSTAASPKAAANKGECLASVLRPLARLWFLGLSNRIRA